MTHRSSPATVVNRDQTAWDEFWVGQSAPAPLPGNDTWHDVVWTDTLERWLAHFETTAPGKRMLECGCGSARVSQYMAARGYDCTVVDYSERALAVAQRSFDALSLRGRFVRGDLRHLPLRSGAFDIVYSGGVLEFFDDVASPVNEMARVLSPAGLFAAHMVPNKISIQSVADVQRTVAYSLRNLCRGRFGAAMQRVRMASPADGVHARPLSEYVAACAGAGLTDTTGRVTGPFPALALPSAAQRLYARVMSRLRPQWRRFDESTSTWTSVWGIAFTVTARKGLQPRQ